MYTPLDRAIRVLELLTEGMSISAVESITGVHHTTILSLLVQVGERCERFAMERVRDIPVKDIQCDEIWGFVLKKEQHKSCEEKDLQTIGDAYCFVALERHTKLVLAWHLGRRDRIACEDFISRVRWATSDRWFQVTTDGFQPYIGAIDAGLSDRVDYAQLVKTYASDREGEARYSPPEVVDAVPTPIFGDPDPKRICTSHVERQNLTMRMQIRRLTRLTNGFSKKWENLKAMLALHFCWYNWCRPHRSVRMTPTMAAGVTDHIWTLRELVEALP